MAKSKKPTAAQVAQAAAHMKRDQFAALEARLQRALRKGLTRGERQQMLTLAEQYVDKMRPEWWGEAERLLAPLREACVPPPAPERSPLTVGALKRLLAPISDATPIGEVMSPEYLANVMRALALVPPVAQAPRAPLQWSKPPGPGNLAPAAKPPREAKRSETTYTLEELGL